MRNQDPLNPADGTQFLTQLAQFSQLEQLIGIRGGIDTLNTQITAPAGQSQQETTGTPQTAV
jgi:flagellar basal-body rod modification protein FlgD